MRLKTIAFALLALLLGYTGFWFFIAGNIGAYLENLGPELEQNGIEFTYDDYEVSGFPYRLVVNLSNPRFTYKNGPLSGEMDSETIEAIIQPWKLGHAILFPQNSTIQIRYGKEMPKEFFIKPQSFGLSFSDNGNEAYRLSLELKEVLLETNLQMDLPAEYESINLHLRKIAPGIVSNDGLFQPKLLDLAFSMTVGEGQSFNTEVSFRGTQIPAVTRESLMAWRDNGGTLEIENATFLNEGRTVQANGSLTLDDQLRPLGPIGLQAQRATDVIALLRAGGYVSVGEAFLLTNAINALPMPEGSSLPVAVSLTIQDGVAAFGPLALFEVGPVIKK